MNLELKMPKLMHQMSNPVKQVTKHSDLDSSVPKDIANTAKKATKVTTSKGQLNKKPALTIDLNAESLKGSCTTMKFSTPLGTGITSLKRVPGKVS